MTIFSDVEEEIECPSCGLEFVVKWDSELILEFPSFCSFCGIEIEDDEEEDDDYIEEDEFVRNK
jgi:hypothetical protein